MGCVYFACKRSAARGGNEGRLNCSGALQLVSSRSIRVAWALYGEIEKSFGKRLIGESVVPVLQVIVNKAPSLHELQQQHAIVVRQRAHVGVCMGNFVKAVKACAHIDAAVGGEQLRENNAGKQFQRQKRLPIVVKPNAQPLKAWLQRLSRYEYSLRAHGELHLREKRYKGKVPSNCYSLPV